MLTTLNPIAILLLSRMISQEFCETFQDSYFEAIARRCFSKKGVLKQLPNSTRLELSKFNFLATLLKKRLPHRRFQACNSIEKETPVQVFSGVFWVIFKNTYFLERLRTVAFGYFSVSGCKCFKNMAITTVAKLSSYLLFILQQNQENPQKPYL